MQTRQMMGWCSKKHQELLSEASNINDMVEAGEEKFIAVAVTTLSSKYQ